MKKPERTAIDRRWFKKSLVNKDKSDADLARHLQLDRSAVSRILSGERRLQSNEASAIADFLAVPLKEVLKHAGVSMDNEGQPTRILLAATVNGAGEIEWLTEPRLLRQSVIIRAEAAIALHGTGQIIAAQVRALEGPLAILDEAVILFAHADEVAADLIGKLSICRNHTGKQILARIERAPKTGEASVITTAGRVEEFDLQTATPVIAIIP